MPAVWSASSQQMLAFISGNVKKKTYKVSACLLENFMPKYKARPR